MGCPSAKPKAPLYTSRAGKTPSDLSFTLDSVEPVLTATPVWDRTFLVFDIPFLKKQHLDTQYKWILSQMLKQDSSCCRVSLPKTVKPAHLPSHGGPLGLGTPSGGCLPHHPHPNADPNKGKCVSVIVLELGNWFTFLNAHSKT